MPWKAREEEKEGGRLGGEGEKLEKQEERGRERGDGDVNVKL